MTHNEQKKLLATNAIIWMACMLISFILPNVAESITDGDASFLKALVQTGPLFVGTFLTHVLISKAVGQPSEQ